MSKRWILVVDQYEGIRKNAINMLSGYISGLISYVLPVKTTATVTEDEMKEYNVIAVGTCRSHPILADCEKRGLITLPSQAEGYSIYVGENGMEEDTQTILIAGTDDKGVLYGCMQFINEYCGDQLYKHVDLWGQ